MTFAALAEHCKETRYCEAFYDEQGRKLYGVREPKKFASMISRLVSFLGHLKLSDITVSHLQQYRRKRLSTKTNRGTSGSTGVGVLSGFHISFYLILSYKASAGLLTPRPPWLST